MKLQATTFSLGSSVDIAILGGMGAFASLRFHELLLQNLPLEKYTSDLDYPNIMHISIGGYIPDRTKFLLGMTDSNPGEVLGELIQSEFLDLISDSSKAAIIVPCCTFHHTSILSRLFKASSGAEGRLINLVENVYNLLLDLQPITVGYLCTNGSRYTNLWSDLVERSGAKVTELPSCYQNTIHEAIYAPAYGLKMHPYGTIKSISAIQAAINYLSLRECDAIILGCTELSMISDKLYFEGGQIIDPLVESAKSTVKYLYY